MNDSMPQTLLIAAVIIGVSILILLLIRQIYLWYFRINDIADSLLRQEKLLQKIAGMEDAVVSDSELAKSNQWKCPKCETVNDGLDNYLCTKCGYRR